MSLSWLRTLDRAALAACFRELEEANAQFGTDARGGAVRALAAVVEGGGNVFERLVETVEVCSLGQITERLQEVVGRYRPSV